MSTEDVAVLLAAEVASLTAERDRLREELRDGHRAIALKLQAAQAELEDMTTERETMKQVLNASRTVFEMAEHRAKVAEAERDRLQRELDQYIDYAGDQTNARRAADADRNEATANYSLALQEIAKLVAERDQLQNQLEDQAALIAETDARFYRMADERDKARAERDEARGYVDTAVLAAVKADADRGELMVRLTRAETDLYELQAVFDLQWDRTQEASALWRAESPAEREGKSPSLGTLLAWFMNRLVAAEKVAELTLELPSDHLAGLAADTWYEAQGKQREFWQSVIDQLIAFEAAVDDYRASKEKK
jgi:chromosome segregation ATPase